jgi:hypothetical protein
VERQRASLVFDEDAVQGEAMKVRIQPKIAGDALHRRDGSALVSTHWRSGAPGGMTCSTRFAAVAAIRRPKHEGQKARPLHENATTFRFWQSGHASTAASALVGTHRRAIKLEPL